MTASKYTLTIDKELKDEAMKVFNEMDIDMSTGIRMYLSQVVRDREIPFTPSLNSKNEIARKQALHGDNVSFDDMASLKEYIDKL